MIYLATPAYGGLVTTRYMLSIMQLTAHGLQNGYSTTLNLLGKDSLITRSRNTLVANFLTVPEATHFMFVDADIGFEAEQVQRMLDFDEDVVAGMYPLKAMNWNQPAHVVAGEPPETAMLHYVGQFCAGDQLEVRDGFVTGEYCGTGFMLMKRAVIERMVAAYPETAYRSDHVYVQNAAEGVKYHALFECMIDPETGEYLSEDFGFCRRWRKLGGKIWLDALGSLSHTGSFDFVGNPAARFFKGLT
ncbi:hypothetical protein EYW49_20195 [Siculibacillus lacustris]|uniref:Glycosyltransferase family 2 protein n=2 Tax=Siculibacillus lacustris TaxID=1549641 RepID=A0A4Q9VFG4_9HYPH|nr:hypothetical protein EYW49_20195 [Siculibacillus lacustris]